ncbi:MAG: hypothetical protein H5T62_09490 [Anaerolineae bacterium]|nr:hypothetical protein [Anaerolineae bacterium]
MSLDIWFREDILHALQAADQASATTAAAMGEVAGDPRYLRAYREGYRAALVTVAIAFGIEPAEEKSLFAAAGSEALPEPQPVVRQRFFA